MTDRRCQSVLLLWFAQGLLSPDPLQPGSVLTLGEALRFAVARNPRLATFSWRIRAREAGALQAGLAPNPRVGVEVENFAGSGEASGFDTITLLLNVAAVEADAIGYPAKTEAQGDAINALYEDLENIIGRMPEEEYRERVQEFDSPLDLSINMAQATENAQTGS